MGHTRFPRRLFLSVTAAVFSMSAAVAQQPAPDPDEANIADLIMASHMLANEGVMDSFGHATVRSVKDPTHLFMPRAMPPGQIQRKDIVELSTTDCATVDHSSVTLNGERFIHCQIYKARPDVISVIHTHDPAVLPFPISKTPLRVILAQSGFLPDKTPVFDVRDAQVPGKGMLVNNAPLGDALAKALGNNPVVLMRGHGDTIVGNSVKQTAMRAIYTDLNAKAQLQAATLSHDLIVLNKPEMDAYDREQRPDRPWENFRQRLPPDQR